MLKDVSQITLEDINMTVNYDDLAFLESHLMHEYKRLGKDGMLDKYGKNIESFREDWSHIKFCFLLGVLEFLGIGFEYDDSVCLDRYVLPPDIRFCMDCGVYEESMLSEIKVTANESFIKRGFLYEKVYEAV